MRTDGGSTYERIQALRHFQGLHLRAFVRFAAQILQEQQRLHDREYNTHATADYLRAIQTPKNVIWAPSNTSHINRRRLKNSV